MIYASLSDKGKVRLTNQDNYANLKTEDFSLFIVADGMGGHNAGEIASKIAVESIRNYIHEKGARKDYSELLENSIIYANNKILEKSKLNPECYQMGTTVICALIDNNNKAYIANLGDSRIYHHQNGKLRQVTKDDSYIQSLIDTGAEGLDKDFLDHYKNIVTKALGIDSKVEIEVSTMILEKNDYLMLVTDGLTNMVEDSEIEEVLNLEIGIQESCEILVYMANSSGGFDNITVTLVRI
ncbi:MAG: Stp1/IreP family PP2C-type Ser/Thr phosphatase [Tissierellia bacterium]|nr:Stp1/IreP family PP2C-type Ser/Thr phosphatase [Tissierellia bacterium]